MAISTIGVANGAEFDGGAVWTDIDSSSDRRTAAMALSPCNGVTGMRCAQGEDVGGCAKLARTEHLEGDTQVIRRLTLLATELVQNTLRNAVCALRWDEVKRGGVS